MVIVYGVLLLALIFTPFDSVLPWMFNRSREIHSRLDRPASYIYFSKAPLVAGLAKVLDFLKGYGVPYVVAFQFEDVWLTLLAIVLTLVGHNWTPFLGMKNRQAGLFVLWGVYTFMLPMYFWLFPVGVALYSLLFNAPHLGLMLTLLSYGFVFWFYQTDPSDLIVNFVVFVTTFLALFDPILNHFETGEHTLKNCFERRV